MIKKRPVKKRKYYVLLDKGSNKVYILTNRQAIADRIGVHRNTICNRLKGVQMYCDENHIIWCDVPVIYRK